jgi:hypothetical protein
MSGASSLSGVIGEFFTSYGKTPRRVRLLDAFAMFQLVTAVIQVCFCTNNDK